MSITMDWMNERIEGWRATRLRKASARQLDELPAWQRRDIGWPQTVVDQPRRGRGNWRRRMS